MICAACKTRVRITQTIAVGSSKVQLGECPRCGKRFTFVTVCYGEAKPSRHGTGIKAVAKKLRERLEDGNPPQVNL